MKKFLSLLALVALIGPIAAPAQAVTFSDFELNGVVEVVSYWDDPNDEYYYWGSGFFTDFSSGCVLTAAHVIVDENNQIRDSLFVVTDAGTQEETWYTSYAVIAYTDADTAYICIDDETFEPKFRHFFLDATDTFDSVQVGDNLTAVGFPSFGEETITAVFGHLLGFLPWLGEKDVLKTDLQTTGGISGGPVLTDDKRVVGMIISGGLFEGVSYTNASSIDLLNYASNVALEDLVDEPDCVLDEEETFFERDGVSYYDVFCEDLRDEATEDLIQNQYGAWCGDTLDDDYARDAAWTVEADIGLNMEDWKDYLGGLCGGLSADNTLNYFTPDQDPHVSLVKSNEFTAVYAVTNEGKRNVFPSTAVYASWFGENFGSVTTISAEELASYPIGKSMTFHPGTLIKIPSIAKVYLVTDDLELRWIEDEHTAATLFGADWAKLVKDVLEPQFTSYSVGESIVL